MSPDTKAKGPLQQNKAATSDEVQDASGEVGFGNLTLNTFCMIQIINE